MLALALAPLRFTICKQLVWGNKRRVSVTEQKNITTKILMLRLCFLGGLIKRTHAGNILLLLTCAFFLVRLGRIMLIYDLSIWFTTPPPPPHHHLRAFARLRGADFFDLTPAPPPPHPPCQEYKITVKVVRRYVCIQRFLEVPDSAAETDLFGSGQNYPGVQ
jgi:hypothetical protein